MAKVETWVTVSLIALIIASIFSAGLNIIKETNIPIKDGLKLTFGHHWIGHGVVTVLVFAVSIGILYPIVGDKKIPTEKLMLWSSALVFISVLVIIIFYVAEYLAA